MKKFISLMAAAAICAAVSGAVMAAEDSPAVFVDNAEIIFDDQPATIVDSRTLVPARGVFEAMGAKVDWKEEERQVQIESYDHKTIVMLTIDDSNMKVYDMSGMFATLLSGQDFNAPETVVELDVAPQIMNDRTMIPLRAISEALDAEVEWNGEVYCVDITTKNAPTEEKAASMRTLSISADVDTVAEGETFDLYVNAANIPEGMYVGGVTATVRYNKEDFEFVSAKLMNGDEVVEDAMGADNGEFAGEFVKAAYVTINADQAAKADGKVMKLTFKSLTGKMGVFSLSGGYQTKLGFNTALLLDYLDGSNPAVNYDGYDLVVDTTPVFVNETAAE